VQSDFQLIAGTNRDLGKEVAAGRFREDLYARINLWTYELPGLAQRSEDIEPNLDYLLAQYGAETGERVRFNKEARERFMRFATLPTSAWKGNFRDLSAAVTRLATLSEAGRITDSVVDEEIRRLNRMWQHHDGRTGRPEVDLAELMGEQAAAQLDLFDALQLQAVIKVCRQSNNMSDAGRKLYAVSRDAKAKPNDADRLKKYLTKFGVNWEDVSR
jgi:transcriptional regulatory protein RtcR